MKYSRNYQTPSLARLHLVWVALCFCVTIGFSEDDQDNDNVCLDPETNEDPDYIWEGEPDCEYAKYTLSISPPDEGDVFAVGSGSTGSASASRITASGTTPKTDEISWSGDVSGTGATSSDFTTSVGAKSLTASFGGFSDSVGVTVVGVASVECVGTTSTTDEPGTDETVYIRKGNSGETVTLTAATNPADTSWPEGNPTWAGGDVVNNNDGSASFPIDEVSDSKNGTTVTVTCGTSKKSIKIVVFDVQRLSLSCLGTPAGIHLGDIPGRSEKVAYFSQVTLAGVLGVSPKDLDILEVRLSQYLCGAHISLGLDGDDDDITLPPGVPPGADIEFSGFTFNPISGYYSGSVDDEPAQFFGTELVASTLCPVSTNVDANVYMEWKLPTDTAWETIGKATWTWGGDLSYAQGNFTVNGGIIGVTGVSSNEEPKNPGPCGGE